jgi:hypothetical protein
MWRGIFFLHSKIWERIGELNKVKQNSISKTRNVSRREGKQKSQKHASGHRFRRLSLLLRISLILYWKLTFFRDFALLSFWQDLTSVHLCLSGVRMYCLRTHKNIIIRIRGVKQSKLWLNLYKKVQIFFIQNKYHSISYGIYIFIIIYLKI